MAKQDRINAAARLLEDFSGTPAKRRRELRTPEHDVLLEVGRVDGIMYTAKRDGKTQRYVHEFRASSRPVLAVSHDGAQLYLLAGAYKFTDRGIEDK